MKYSFYMHDLHYEIGHANVTIDMINNLPSDNTHHYHFVVFTADSVKNLFPELSEQVTFHFVPFPKIKITFFKIIFYQIYTFLYAMIFDKADSKISLGVANLNCDISIIHFIHHQWRRKYFSLLKPNLIRKIYKSIFFFYLDICEKILFKYKKPKLITVSKFMEHFIRDHFNYPSSLVKTIHSGFDQNRFSTSKQAQSELFLDLQKIHPEIKNINLEEPLCLFVGAFERKGLEKLLTEWSIHSPKGNLLIIGKSETQKSFDLSKYSNVYHIAFTKEINLFYEIADYFFFPTHYEPFGMVLIEAAIKGLKIYSSSENVGAAEVLQDSLKIKFYNNVSNFLLPKDLAKLTHEERSELISKRQKQLSHLNWENISKTYSDFLK